ncbi:MAG: RNA polymerase-binding protein DksA, partial [Burkholderiales bacterium]
LPLRQRDSATSMTKRKTASRRKAAASRKKPGALKKLARRAMKLVKTNRAKAVAAPKPAAAKPATVHRPAPASKPRPRGGNSGYIPPPGGVISEADVRRMPESAYMNDIQLEFFRQRLLQMRAEVVDREVDVKERLHQRESFADPADRATAEEEHWLDLRLRERESLLLRKIDDALRRLENREYGYCEKTGDPIGIPRLLARPTATVCVDVKGQDERVEAQFRDR